MVMFYYCHSFKYLIVDRFRSLTYTIVYQQQGVILNAFNIFFALKPFFDSYALVMNFYAFERFGFLFFRKWFWFLKVWFAGRFIAAAPIFTLLSLLVTLGSGSLHFDDWSSMIFSFPLLIVSTVSVIRHHCFCIVKDKWDVIEMACWWKWIETRYLLLWSLSKKRFSIDKVVVKWQLSLPPVIIFLHNKYKGTKLMSNVFIALYFWFWNLVPWLWTKEMQVTPRLRAVVLKTVSIYHCFWRVDKC